MNVSKWLMVMAVMLASMPGYTQPASAAGSQMHGMPADRHVQPERGHWHGLQAVLRKLNLTDAQKVQAKTLLEQVRKQHESLIKGERDNWLTLLSVDPSGPDYAALLATQKANMAALIQLRSDTWIRLYALLTPEQQARLPSIVHELQNPS